MIEEDEGENKKRDREINDLREMVAKLSARIDKLEKPDRRDKDGKDGKGINPHDADRLGKLEKDLGKLRADVTELNHPVGRILFASGVGLPTGSTLAPGSTVVGIQEQIPFIYGDAETGTLGFSAGPRSVSADDMAAMALSPFAYDFYNNEEVVPYIEIRVGNRYAYVRMSPPPRLGLFPVALARDGGSNGDESTAATYTYHVTGLLEIIELPGVSPVVARPIGFLIDATWGLGYYAPRVDGQPPGSEDFVLLYAFEIPDTDACPDP